MKKFILFALLIFVMTSCKKGSSPGEDAKPNIDVTGFWLIPDDPNNGTLQINFDNYKYYSTNPSVDEVSNTYHVSSKADGFYIYFDGFFGPLDFFKEYTVSKVSRPSPDKLVLVSTGISRTITLTRKQ